MTGPTEKHLAKMFQANGLSKTVSKSLACFKDDEELTMYQIETRAKMRQPEVSVSVKVLVDNGWLVRASHPLEGKGRPYQSLKLAVPFKQIIKDIADDRAAHIKEQENRVLELLAAVA